MRSLQAAIDAVAPVDQAAAGAARERQASLTKPAGSLGALERLHAQFAAIQRTPLPAVERPCVLVLAADHGVAAEGVSAYPARVTGEMACNFAAGGAAINVLARGAGARLIVVDVGIDWDDRTPPGGILRRPIRAGTRNLAAGPAMSPAETVRALETGVEVARSIVADGADLLGLGDMGIGNTTAAAAIIAALTGRPARAVTGRGTGVGPAAWDHKVRTIERALARFRPTADDPVATLAQVGGLEIAALAGAILGGAAARTAILLDGVIVGAAALVAVALCPAVRPYLIASHRSAEPGHRAALEYLELEPLMDLGLRLGEGSGAALALPLVRAACRLPHEMATFAEAGVSEQSPRSSAVDRRLRPISAARPAPDPQPPLTDA